MRAKDCSDPTSWYYQGAIHWIPDTIQDNKLCPFYHTYLEKKVNLHNTMLTKLKNDKTNFIDKENSAKELYNIFTKFINETKLDNYNDTVVNSFIINFL